jgi:periplasmic protein TonB
MVKSLYLLNSVFLSLLVTIGLFIFFVSYYLQLVVKATHYTIKKETLFEVSLMDFKSVVSDEATKDPVVQKQLKSSTKMIKEETSKTPNIGSNFQELFREIKTQKPVKKSFSPSDTDDAIARRKKSLISVATGKSMEAVEMTEKIVLSKTVAFSVATGEYDEYYARIQEFLWSHWNPVGYPLGAQSKVLVSIDGNGRFLYRILSSFGDDSLDLSFKNFLETMRLVQFPPFEKGKKTDIEVTFKAER